MLHTHTTPDRLELYSRAPVMGVFIGLFVLLSVLLMIALPLFNLVDLAQRGGAPLRLFGLGLIMALGALFVYLGTPISLAILRGTHCVFDRRTATVTLTRPENLRLAQYEYPLYGGSQLVVERNDEIRTFAVYLALRSGETILLATVPYHDQAAVEQAVQQVRAFLRG